MRIVTRMAILEGAKMDNYEIDRLLSDLSRQLEDLSYRVYTLEDSMAHISAHLEEQKEESVNA